MAIYAIGDIQGCQCSLQRLIDKLGFDKRRDKLWFTGDLVNRGPDSLETLRFIRKLGKRAVCVLGNHDLHLLAVNAGLARQKKRDTLDTILAAPDRDELIDWLRHRPLAVHKAGFLMVHAGLPPQWDVKKTLACAAEVESVLRGDNYRKFLRKMYGDQPDMWNDKLSGNDRLRCIVNYLTRVRYCRRSGRICHNAKGPVGSQPEGFMPWFRVPGRASTDTKIIFGHWSVLGPVDDPGIHALDTGCVWGGKLSALCLDNPKKRISVRCKQSQPVTGNWSRLT
jgi:bis(5'-nucleosyl)-tetraphosphatase (symmetrical)